MAANTITAEAVLSREQLRTFHMSGQGIDEMMPARPLRPTSLASLTALPELEAFYPMCVHPEGAAQPFRELVSGLEHAGIITSAFRTAMNGQPSLPLEDVAEEAINSLADCPRTEIARLRKLLPEGAFLVAFHTDALILLHAAASVKQPTHHRAFFDA